MPRTDYLNDPNAPEPNSIVPAASAIVTNDAGEILLQRRRDNDLWALPGGTMDVGERIADTAVREVREETGLDVEVTGIVGIYSDPAHVIAYPAHVIAYTDGEVRQEFNICFAAKLLGGRLSKSEESTELRWVDPRTVGSLPMHESIRLRIKHFLENRPAPSSPDRAPRRTPTPANGKGTTDGSALLVNVG